MNRRSYRAPQSSRQQSFYSSDRGGYRAQQALQQQAIHSQNRGPYSPQQVMQQAPGYPQYGGLRSAWEIGQSPPPTYSASNTNVPQPARPSQEWTHDQVYHYRLNRTIINDYLAQKWGNNDYRVEGLRAAEIDRGGILFMQEQLELQDRRTPKAH
ncbi:hypothetical protein ACLMJK_004025 [Lecanora helva]